MSLPTDLLTISRMKSARACLRLHKLRYLEGWRPVREADTLRFGTLIHAGLEAWWQAPMAHRLDAALAALDVEADPYDRARARALIVGYDARWADQRYETLGVEVAFVAPLVNPDTGAASRTYSLAGKIDAIVRDAHGRVLIVEHKTSSEDVSTGSEYWRRLVMDGQVSVYFEGARSLGHDVEGCLYDVIAKPGLRPYKATPPESRKYTKDGSLYANQREEDETPDAYEARLLEAIAAAPDKFFARGEVPRLETELDEARADAWQTGRLLRESELAGRAPRNPDACVRYGRTCDFFDVCAGQASLDDPSRFIRLTHSHPELSGSPTPDQETTDGPSLA